MPDGKYKLEFLFRIFHLTTQPWQQKKYTIIESRTIDFK